MNVVLGTTDKVQIMLDNDATRLKLGKGQATD